MSHGSCAYLELPTKLTHINTATTCIHDRAVAIRFGAISLVVRTQECYTVGGLGACSPRKILKFRGYEITSETNFGPIRCFSEAKRQSFTWMPFCPLRRTPMVSAFRSRLLIGRKPHPSQEARKTNRKNGKLLKDSQNSSVALFAAILQVSTWYLCASGRCVGVLQAMVLITNVRQATSEGKSGPVEKTGLTGPAATALHEERWEGRSIDGC